MDTTKGWPSHSRNKKVENTIFTHGDAITFLSFFISFSLLSHDHRDEISIMHVALNMMLDNMHI